MELWHVGDLNGGVILRPQVGYDHYLDSSDETEEKKEGSMMPGGRNILYTFPSGSSFSYPDFIEQLVMTGWDMDLSRLERPWWSLELDPSATIATVDGEKDLRILQSRFPCPANPCWAPRRHLDWPAIAAEFDAFWLTYAGFLWGYEPENWRDGCELCFFSGEVVIIFNAALITKIEPLN